MDRNLPLCNLSRAVLSLFVVALLSWFVNPTQLFYYMGPVAAWCAAFGTLLVIRLLLSSEWIMRLGMWLNGFTLVMFIMAVVLVTIAVTPYWNWLVAYSCTLNSFFGALLWIPMVLAIIALGALKFSMLLSMLRLFFQSIFSSDSVVQHAW